MGGVGLGPRIDATESENKDVGHGRKAEAEIRGVLNNGASVERQGLVLDGRLVLCLFLPVAGWLMRREMHT